MTTNNLIIDLTFKFAVEVITYTEKLEQLKKFVVAKQLQRSGLSVGLNTSESQDAESRADFVHKLKIALKEANESHFILSLCKKHPSYPDPGDLIDQIEVIRKVLGKIVFNTKFKKRNN
ncbi:MAG: four helix bundle protein [Flavobacteriales bacterium]